jgi:hypothetical protein
MNFKICSADEREVGFVDKEVVWSVVATVDGPFVLP